MVSMKIEKPKNDHSGLTCGGGDNPYGYGLTISLDVERMTLLGIDPEKYPVGTEVMLKGVATVSSASEYEGPEGKDRHTGLQITDLNVSHAPDGDVASRFYGSGSDDSQ